jgi:hypothetical protein
MQWTPATEILHHWFKMARIEEIQQNGFNMSRIGRGKT